MKRLIAILTILLTFSAFASAKTKQINWQGKDVKEKIPNWIKKFDNEKKVASYLKINQKEYEIILVKKTAVNLQMLQKTADANLRSAAAYKLAGETKKISNNKETAEITTADIEIENLKKKASFWIQTYDTKTRQEFFEFYIVGTLQKTNTTNK